MTRVLVVDDELDICIIISSYLQKLNFEVHYARSVKEALLKAEAIEYQLLFVDIDLPDGSGFDVIAHLQKFQLDLKIVVVSAYQNEVKKAMEIGANLFIAKPFSIKSIDNALRTLNLLSL